MSRSYIDHFADDFGPEKVIHIYEPKSKLKAIVVIDNLSLGVAVGGCRIASDVTGEEVFRLARAMTLKNALANLPHGGAKSAIIARPDDPEKEKLIRAFAVSIKHLTEYIPGPDMGTDETCMAYIYDEIGRAVGLPKVLGGLPLDQLGTTGFGVAIAADVASEILGIPLKGARVVIQGFGNVGSAAARNLTDRGARLMATCDINGGVYHPNGLDVPALLREREKGVPISESRVGQSIPRDSILDIESDIFIPAARPDIVTEANQHLLNTRLILEGANIPITHGAAKMLHNRGIWLVPDIIANSGGVICAATELLSLTEANAFDRIQTTITENTEELLERVKEENLPPHEVALGMAKERISQAMTYRAHM
ncbi:MAG: glutamate dehydrogenase [Nitrospinae bacterium CG11_big_fil_rev_8_21_14_0_20_56_8]|nr:MAG: glutamate dehydrogenase [Nitrospinae bacterium CG11_big_fil_rev_8_21_14_0_20_56_8]